MHVTTVNTISDLALLIEKQPDVVFAGLKYLPDITQEGTLTGKKIWISEYLEAHGIAHTGSPGPAIALEFDKPQAKRRILAAGVRTAAFIVVKRNDVKGLESHGLRFPLFVKPATMGGGSGIDENSIVSNQTELQTQVSCLTTRYSTDILVEEYLPGREFSVSILKDDYSSGLQIMPIELVAEANTCGHRVLSQRVKSANREVTLLLRESSLKAQIIDLAGTAFQALSARDYGRIDLRLDVAGVPHFLEANLIPSLIKGYGSFPKACELNAGINYESMILRIVRLGLDRSAAPDLYEVPVLPLVFQPMSA